MDTGTITGIAERELSAAEAQIATIEICDRLTRYAKASTIVQRFRRSNPKCDELKPNIQELLSRLNIPREGFFSDHSEVSFTQDCVCLIRPKVAHWVKGMLFEDECLDMLVMFTEFYELDFSWVFFGIPMNYYTLNENHLPQWEEHDAIKAFIKVGTRSERKHSSKRFQMITSPTGWSFELKHKEAT